MLLARKIRNVLPLPGPLLHLCARTLKTFQPHTLRGHLFRLYKCCRRTSLASTQPQLDEPITVRIHNIHTSAASNGVFVHGNSYENLPSTRAQSTRTHARSPPITHTAHNHHHHPQHHWQKKNNYRKREAARNHLLGCVYARPSIQRKFPKLNAGCIHNTHHSWRRVLEW